MSVSQLRIAVLGAGISGLAAAHRLLELDPELEITLLEASDRAGGILGTIRCGDYLVERSADMFTTRDPWALDLARRVGLENEIIGTRPTGRKALIVSKGQLHSVPEGFMLMSPTKLWPIATSPLLGWSAKARMLGEWFIRPRTDHADESLADFTRRRFGRDAFERLVQPLVGGIYTADPEKLSMAATMPQFLAMEKQHGSVLRGMLKTAGSGPSSEGNSGVRYGQFVAPRLGMQQLVDAIIDRLPAGALQLNSRVTSIARNENGGWSLQRNEGGTLECDGLIYALPGSARELLRGIAAPLADEIGRVPLAGCAVVVSGYRRSQIGHPLDAFGFVVPAIEGRQIIAGSFASNKFPGRAPDDRILIRTFIGGALQPDLAELPDDQLKGIAARELGDLLQARGEPEVCQVVRWLGMMPQYHVGHLERVARIEALVNEIPQFALAGNLYRGVGIPFCIRGGEAAAERVLSACRAARPKLSAPQ